MKKSIIIILCIIGLIGCTKASTFSVNINMQSNKEEEYAFSDTIISPVKSVVTIHTDRDVGDSMVCIEPVNEAVESFEFYVIPGVSNDVKLEKDVWYRIGVLNKNTSDQDILVRIQIEGVEVAIEDK